MITFVYFVIFLLVTLYVLLRAIGYGLYEIHEQNNKFGGIAVISFSCVSVLFANLVLWLK